MARLHEHQGKAILLRAGVAVPRGRVARSADEAEAVAQDLGGACVVKIQAWTTGRAAIGGVALVASAEEARRSAERMLGMTVGAFPVNEVLVEERLPIARELFVSFSIDDRARAPVLLLGASGGSGVEERAAGVARIPCSVHDGPGDAAVHAALKSAGLDAKSIEAVSATVATLFSVAKANEARSLEVNPLAITQDGRIVALDCRMTIDDAAVFRHPDLGIEIARELDHPPTELEKIAYRVEQEDHRGTFFFAQMNTTPAPGSRGLVGFHGAGGGGSMMSMDAITNAGFTIANFTDTSGNPSAAKVYRAARIILSQPGLCGYFGSGSGVASQEQFWSAYGLAKAFWELDLDIPAVIRLGGNTEDRAVDILQSSCRAAGLRATVEGYKKSDPPAKIAARLAALVSPDRREGAAAGGPPRAWTPRPPRRPRFVGQPTSPSFPVRLGRVWINPDAWRTHGAAVMARANGLLRDDAGSPALAVRPEEFLAKDSDMIACEVECRRDGIGGSDGAVFVELDMPAEFRTSPP